MTNKWQKDGLLISVLKESRRDKDVICNSNELHQCSATTLKISLMVSLYGTDKLAKYAEDVYCLLFKFSQKVFLTVLIAVDKSTEGFYLLLGLCL